MTAIGEEIKLRRKEMRLSLKEVENATSIRMSYLQAIEDGDMDRLISPIYAQGFVRQYAQFLGLDGDRLVSDNSALFSPPSPQEFDYGIGTLEKRGSPGSSVRGLPNLVWILGSIGALVAAWYLAKSLGII